jgi:N-methylhydantoinase B
VLVPRIGANIGGTFAGGGGSGLPFECDPVLVLEDVLEGKVGVEAAREPYGVVILGGEVDERATGGARA